MFNMFADGSSRPKAFLNLRSFTHFSINLIAKPLIISSDESQLLQFLNIVSNAFIDAVSSSML